jgi:AraC family transcriptional regulator, regulatory protein of adaptative response / DNA-3-methyladenine glycosylase II
VILDDEQRYRAVSSRDARFDGWFIVAVTSTKIYCRPSCTALTPKASNCRYYSNAAAAQQNGFRACKRCRPDATPGSPEWNIRADLVGRAMRLICDGVIDRDGVSGLASRLGYSERHLTRTLTEELGAGPIALARAQRAHTARTLIETTEMPFTEVAFAAGFSSIRQFNDTVREVFANSPTELRVRRRVDSAGSSATSGTISLRLPFRPPLDVPSLFGFLGLRAVPGVESWDGTTFRRVLDLPHGLATVGLTPQDTYVQADLVVTDLRDVATAVSRCRRMLDLDADPDVIDAHLGADALLGPLVAASPGRRSPGHVDGNELAVRAVLGQQVSVVGARTLAARLAARHGQALDQPDGELTHAFPRADALAAMDPAELAMPHARRRALLGMCEALADHKVVIDPGADRDELHASLVALHGIGPWTAQYVAMRALGDPDVFMPTDLGVKHALNRLGVDGSPKGAAVIAERWRPWRSYALHHLWGSL